MIAGSLSLLSSAAATSEPDRPSWKVGQSVCHSFEGFQPGDLFPIRSPLVVADFLGPQLAPRQVQTPPRLAAWLTVVSRGVGPSCLLLLEAGICNTPGRLGGGFACRRRQRLRCFSSGGPFVLRDRHA
jgi:hypothetical protein